MTREQLYTMVSRGRTANHIYVSVGGDGDPHAILQAEVREPTATDLLQRVLRRSSLPVSATTARMRQDAAAAVRGGVPSHKRTLGCDSINHGPGTPGR